MSFNENKTNILLFFKNCQQIVRAVDGFQITTRFDTERDVSLTCNDQNDFNKDQEVWQLTPALSVEVQQREYPGSMYTVYSFIHII